MSDKNAPNTDEKKPDLLPELPTPKRQHNGLLYNGSRGMMVSLESKAIGGGDLILERDKPVRMGDKPDSLVSPEYAAELVAAGIAEFVHINASEPAPE